MKQTSLFLLFFPLLLWSCKDEEQCPAKDYVEATFQLTGEWAEDYPQFEEFMDYIGIEVLHADGTPYAYGLFDDIDSPKIKLYPNEQYIIRAMLVPNGSVEIPIYISGCHGVTDIFWLNKINAEGKRQCSNVGENFIYDNEIHFWQLERPLYTYPYKIYAGHIPLYTPSSEHIITLDMKRMFGTIRFEYDEKLLQDAEFCFFKFKYSEPHRLTPYLPANEEQILNISLVSDCHTFGWMPEFNHDHYVGIQIGGKAYDIGHHFEIKRGETINIYTKLY